jgi:rSAM/selenodomain-associated transferase 2
MMENGIAIIIPALNEEANMEKLLPYLQENNAGFVNEIIVVDGGSDDDTVQTAIKFGAKCITSSKGRSRQMNAGASSASSEIFYFLHADTFPPRHFDNDIIQQIKTGIDSGCFTLRFDDAHPLLSFYSYFTRFSSTLLRFGDQSLFVKKELFEKIGGFDESLIVMEDQKIVRECKKQGTFKLIQKPVITSAAKYRMNGVVKLQFVFTLIWLLYYLGVSQARLKTIYNRMIKMD